jgi:hypothetical protein
LAIRQAFARVAYIECWSAETELKDADRLGGSLRQTLPLPLHNFEERPSSAWGIKWIGFRVWLKGFAIFALRAARDVLGVSGLETHHCRARYWNRPITCRPFVGRVPHNAG